MNWKESQRGFPWGIVVLFEVGISVGTALLHTQAAGWLANLIVPTVISVLTAVQTPGINVIGMTMLLQFVVSFGFMLPANAPQNMIAYGTDTRGLIVAAIGLSGRGCWQQWMR